MTVEVEINGRRYRAAVGPAGRAETGAVLRVVLQALDDGKGLVERIVSVRETDLGLLLVHRNGRVQDAALTGRGRGKTFVQLPRIDLLVGAAGPRLGDASRASGATTGEQRVVAPMPGRIVRVLVREDDPVTAGQALVIIEAMKMENALTAVGDGRVREVTVSEGTSVEAGRLLVVVA